RHPPRGGTANPRRAPQGALQRVGTAAGCRPRRTRDQRPAGRRQSRWACAKAPMRRIVFDTTILISAFLRPGGLSDELFGLAADDAFALLLAEPIIAEARDK